MNIKYETENSNIIKSPLWDLMLSTNDCYPVCGCDDDFFDMRLDREKAWVQENDYNLALSQIDQLIINPKIDIGILQLQTGYPFQNYDELKICLLE